jgi:TRAP-type C4-dicarboxylate transport system permease large subunit
MLAPLHVDLVWFGVSMIVTLMIGQITPPVGMCLFTVAKVAGIQLDKLSVSVLPFIIPEILVTLLCILFPVLITWLPSVIM